MKREKRFSGLMLIILCLAATVMFVQGSFAQEAGEEKTKNPVIAKYDGKTITLDEFIQKKMFQAPGRSRARVGQKLRSMDVEALKQQVKDYYFLKSLVEKAKSKKTGQDEKISRDLDTLFNQMMAERVYKMEVTDKIEAPSEKEIKQNYEDSKEKKYKRPFSFKMSLIFLSAYKSYTVKEGDALEGIAEKISGDKMMVDNILVDNKTKERRWVKPEDREETPFKPLEAGEKLLVPMNSAEKKAVEKSIRKIHRDIKNGADFIKTARQYSENDSQKGEVIGPIIPSRDTKPMLPAILNAVKETPNGEITNVIKTKHGFNIIKVVEKKEEGYLEFEKARQNIENIMRGERLRKRSDESLVYIAKNTPGVIINEDVFTAEDRTSDSVIIDLGDGVTVTLRDYHRRRKMPGQEDPESNREKLMQCFQLRSILMPLLGNYGKYKKIDKEKDFSNEYDERRDKILADACHRKLVNDLPKPTLTEVQKYYSEHKDLYTDPEKYDISLIGLRVKKPGEKLSEEDEAEKIDEMKKRLEELKKEIKTKEDFEAKAEEISEDPTRSRKGYIGQVPKGYRRGFDGRLDKMKTGEISEAFHYGAFVYLLRVNEVVEARQRDFKESRQTVENEMIKKRRSEMEDKLTDDLLKEHNFEFLMEKE